MVALHNGQEFGLNHVLTHTMAVIKLKHSLVRHLLQQPVNSAARLVLQSLHWQTEIYLQKYLFICIRQCI